MFISINYICCKYNAFAFKGNLNYWEFIFIFADYKKAFFQERYFTLT